MIFQSLYKFHSNPEELDHYDNIDLIPTPAWKKYEYDHAELNKLSYNHLFGIKL